MVVRAPLLTELPFHSRFSQRSPDVPAGHLHRPVTLSHKAPVQLQGWTQLGPNIPSGHSDTGHTGEGRLETAGPEPYGVKQEGTRRPPTLRTGASVAAGRTLSLTLSSHVVAQRSWRARAFLMATGSISTWVTFLRQTTTNTLKQHASYFLSNLITGRRTRASVPSVVLFHFA